MKRTSFLIVFVLSINTLSNAQYRINKTKYDFQTYTFQKGDKYNPNIAGLASLVVPGFGQCISEEPGRGLAFFAGSIGCLFLGVSAFEVHNPDIGQTMAIVGGLGALSLWIWSIADAPRVAKVNNLAWRDKKKSSLNMNLQPCISTKNYSGSEKITAGISLKLTF